MAEKKKSQGIEIASEFRQQLLANKKAKYPSSMVAGKYDVSKLTKREEEYFRIALARSGVLYIKGEPGLAKSAILRSIADKLDLFYIDLRLSQIDETDVGLFPDKIELDVKYTKSDGSVEIGKQNFLTHIIPEWAHLANNPKTVDKRFKGTFINFEELNRAPLAVRNAALQLLLERQIGFRGFKFADNVFMAATGNLGDEDDTDVEEFDAALKDRLIQVRHDMDFQEWRDTWATKGINVHSGIIGYIQANPEHYYSKPTGENKSDVFPTPRSWTFLSDMMKENFGQRDADLNVIAEPELTQELLGFVMRVAHSYVGTASVTFCKYLKDVNKLTIYDVLGLEGCKYKGGYKNFSKNIKETIDRSKRSELLDKLKKVDITSLEEHTIENLKLFILDLKIDEACSFYLKVLDDDYDDINADDIDPAVLSILNDRRFKKIKSELQDSVNSV
jgi:hypothetical protein